MAYDEITVQLPVQESTQSAEVAVITKQTVTAANGIKIKNAFDNKNNSLVIIVEPTTGGAVTIKAGNNYPNKILGDLVITPTNNKVNAIIIEDISRFENRDGSVCLAFASSFVGSIYAVAKRAGLKPVV